MFISRGKFGIHLNPFIQQIFIKPGAMKQWTKQNPYSQGAYVPVGKWKQTCRYVKHVKIHTISNANICNRPKWIKKGGRGPHLMRRGWQYKQDRWHFNKDPQRAREGGHRSIQKSFLGRESSKCKSPKAGTGNGASRTAEEQGKGATRLGGGGNHSVVRPLTCLCLLLREKVATKGLLAEG